MNDGVYETMKLLEAVDADFESADKIEHATRAALGKLALEANHAGSSARRTLCMAGVIRAALVFGFGLAQGFGPELAEAIVGQAQKEADEHMASAIADVRAKLAGETP